MKGAAVRRTRTSPWKLSRPCRVAQLELTSINRSSLPGAGQEPMTCYGRFSTANVTICLTAVNTISQKRHQRIKRLGNVQ
jgi:hypothetical protein